MKLYPKKRKEKKRYYLTACPEENLLNHYSTRIGTFCHYVRTSLNYAVHKMMKSNGFVSKLPDFPFASTKEDFENLKSIKIIDKNFSKLGSTIREEIQPWRRENAFLWEASDANNEDKHSGPVPILSISSYGIDKIYFASDKKPLPSNFNMLFQATMRVHLVGADEPLGADLRPPSMRATFPVDSGFSGAEVTDALAKVLLEADKAIFSFEGLADRLNMNI